MAAKEIKRLESCREELKKKNAELEEKLKGVEGNRVELKMTSQHTSPINSMLETLQLLMDLGMNTNSVTSNFSQQELFASLEIHAKVTISISSFPFLQFFYASREKIQICS